MEEALLTRLRASTALTALIAARSYWVERPQNTTLPAVTLQLISPGREYTHGGWDQLSAPRVQVDCWGATYGSSKLLARAVRDTLEPAATVDGIAFGASFLDGERDMPRESLPGGQAVFRVSMDYFVWWATAS